MSEIKALIVITLDESGIVHSEIKGQAKALSAMLATTMVKEENKFLELIEISLSLLEYHRDK